METTVVTLYEETDNALQAVQALTDHGFREDEISLVVSDATGEYADTIQADEDAVVGAGAGAVVGAIAGLQLSLIALAIPGIGPILAGGAVATALTGTGVGAAAGGLIGIFAGLGIAEEKAEDYARLIQEGGAVVVVQTEADRSERAEWIMKHYDPVDLEERLA